MKQVTGKPYVRALRIFELSSGTEKLSEERKRFCDLSSSRATSALVKDADSVVMKVPILRIKLERWFT